MAGAVGVELIQIKISIQEEVKEVKEMLESLAEKTSGIEASLAVVALDQLFQVEDRMMTPMQEQ